MSLAFSLLYGRTLTSIHGYWKNHADVQAGFRKGRGTRDQIVNIRWMIEKARELQKNIYSLIDYAKALTVWITTHCGKFFKRWEHQNTLSAS